LVLNSKEWVPNSFLVHKINNCSKKINRNVDAYGGVRGGVYPTSKFFAKLVNKNAKTPKRCTLPQNFHNPYILSLPKFGKNLMDPPPGFSNRVHL
jgi:hypothetical protein